MILFRPGPGSLLILLSVMACGKNSFVEIEKPDISADPGVGASVREAQGNPEKNSDGTGDEVNEDTVASEPLIIHSYLTCAEDKARSSVDYSSLLCTYTENPDPADFGKFARIQIAAQEFDLTSHQTNSRGQLTFRVTIPRVLLPDLEQARIIEEVEQSQEDTLGLNPTEILDNITEALPAKPKAKKTENCEESTADHQETHPGEEPGKVPEHALTHWEESK